MAASARRLSQPSCWSMILTATIGWCLLLVLTASTNLPGAVAQQADFLPAPSVTECRVHIEAALKQVGQNAATSDEDQEVDQADVESLPNEGNIESAEAGDSGEGDDSNAASGEDQVSAEDTTTEEGETTTSGEVDSVQQDNDSAEENSKQQESGEQSTEETGGEISVEDNTASKEQNEESESQEQNQEDSEASSEKQQSEEDTANETNEQVSTENSVVSGEVENAGSNEQTNSDEEQTIETLTSTEENEEQSGSEETVDQSVDNETNEQQSQEELAKDTNEEIASTESDEQQTEEGLEQTSGEDAIKETDDNTVEENSNEETQEQTSTDDTQEAVSGETSTEKQDTQEEDSGENESQVPESSEGGSGEETSTNDAEQSTEDNTVESVEGTAVESKEDSAVESEEKTEQSVEDKTEESKENTAEAGESQQEESGEQEETTSTEGSKSVEADQESVETTTEQVESEEKVQVESEESAEPRLEDTEQSDEEVLSRQRRELSEESVEQEGSEVESEEDAANATEASSVAEELGTEIEIPKDLRPKDHIGKILRLDAESIEPELLLAKTVDSTLRELKRLYDTAIKPLEMLYKYRDLSNRHFGDPEIFSKPLILFMGPWSGGKSTILNYLMDIEYTNVALRTGAEPSPAYFNILMHGEREEVIDGTQLAADWTFSGLQKFGQGLLDRLRGLRLNNRLLEKVNIVEIPGILEVRKQVERIFPFNDACQWFIDRADVIFLVYDPSKLDVGPETEAILDQLKGREYQTRIILNKADQVRPEELMRVQGTLIWNISPLMSSTEPPVMYSTSLWAIPYEPGAPTRLLFAQEEAFLKDIRDAINKRVENKIASARRFAVRVRNHAKMVDCYLTTYYNHKSLFGNKQKISDEIIEHPQNYHIYEGLSTLTNISRYDLPDPEVYRDFFKLNPLYEFQQLSATCTYFRGCPINRLDVAIAYDLPELVGKYKKSVEEVVSGSTRKS